MFVIMLLCTITQVQLAKAETYKGFSYEVDDNTVSIDKYNGKKSTVVIPKKIKGKKVTKIDSYAFAYNRTIKKLVIPEGVESIGQYALFDMQALENITFPQTLKSLTKECGFNFYTEASDFPQQTINVVKGSVAFKFVTKNYSYKKINVSKQKKVVVWYDDNKATWDKELAPKIVVKGKKYGKLPTPTKKGHKFLGWYTKLKGGKKVTAKTKAKKDQVLYAHWEFISKRAMLENPVIKKMSGEKWVQWDTIYFGSYMFDAGDNPDKIEWKVLELQGNKALVISTDCIDAVPYQNRKYLGNSLYDVSEACTWETSDIRKWLNGTENTALLGYEGYHYSDFYGKAFTEQERSMILDTQVTNSLGNATTDKIFLLSVEEYDTPSYYLSHECIEDDVRFSKLATEYSTLYSGDKDDEIFWLRTMLDDKHAYIREGNKYVSSPTYGVVDSLYATQVQPILYEEKKEQIPYVRPAMWIDLSNEELWEVGNGEFSEE